MTTNTLFAQARVVADLAGELARRLSDTSDTTHVEITRHGANTALDVCLSLPAEVYYQRLAVILSRAPVVQAFLPNADICLGFNYGPTPGRLIGIRDGSIVVQPLSQKTFTAKPDDCQRVPPSTAKGHDQRILATADRLLPRPEMG